MLRVEVFIDPGGDFTRSYKVGTVLLGNVTESETRREDGRRDLVPERADGTADYYIVFEDEDPTIIKRGVVTNFKRDQGFWKLIEIALQYAPERKPSG